MKRPASKARQENVPPGATLAAAQTCAHCGLPAGPARQQAPAVPSNEASGTPPLAFCCAGCRAVYEAIQGAGLNEFYALPWTQEAGTPAQPSSHNFEEFDSPEYLERNAHPTGSPVPASNEPPTELQTTFTLEGLHCASCVWLLERLPSCLPGVTEVRIQFGRRQAKVTWDPARVHLSRIAQQLDRFGYTPHPCTGLAQEEIQTREERGHLARLGLAGALAGNVMLLAFALYGGHFSGIAERYETLLKGTAFGLTVFAVLGPGGVFFRGAFSSWQLRRLHMDVPVAIAITLGTLWGGWNSFWGSGEVYFESITAVIFLLLLGRWLQFRQRKRAAEAVDLTRALIPQTALRWNGERFESVPIAALQPGDRIQVLAQTSLPADGVVLEGTSDLDASMLSGESRQQSIGPGDHAFAGTLNQSAPLVIQALCTGDETRVAGLMRLVEEGAQNRPWRVQQADRFAHLLVASVLGLAVITLGLWLYWDPSRAIDQTVTLLIVTCPCALGLATPLAYQAAIASAARRGVLIKNPDVLETLAGSGVCLVDKTGTMTTGDMQLVHWFGDLTTQPAVRALEHTVEHPIAKALVNGLEPSVGGPGPKTAPALLFESSSAQTTVDQVHWTLGKGVEGSVNGIPYRVGSPAWLRSSPAEDPEWLQAGFAEAQRVAGTPILIERAGELVSFAILTDRVAQHTHSAVQDLKRMGWTVAMLTGDAQHVALAVGAQVEIPPDAITFECSPEEKLERIRREQSTQRVVMVGDGVNDAAALAAADCGIAAQGGAEASMQAADVCLLQPGMEGIGTLLLGARRTLRVIRRNAVASAIYNGVGAWGAVAGWIHPWMAAVLMPLSSLTVISLSYRSRTFDTGSMPAPGPTASLTPPPPSRNNPAPAQQASPAPL